MSLLNIRKNKEKILGSSGAIGLPSIVSYKTSSRLSRGYYHLYQRFSSDLVDTITKLHIIDDWQDAGIKPIEKETLDKFGKFMDDIYRSLGSKLSLFPMPLISPSDEGSIDIHFRNEKLDILLNFPEKENIVYISSDDYDDMILEASVPLSVAKNLIMEWMIELILK